MSAPGSGLRTWLAQRCGEQTMRTIVEPAIADLQLEHRESLGQGRRMVARWRVLAGTVMLGVALAQHGWGRWRATRNTEWSADELRGLVRAVALSLVAAGMVTLMLIAAGAPWRSPVLRHTWWTVLPQALVIAIPLGITTGLFSGLDRERVTWRLRRTILGLALAAGMVAFVSAGWLVPAMTAPFGRVLQEMLRERADVGPGSFPPHIVMENGLNELTWSELRSRMADPTASPFTRRGRDLAMAWHRRVVLPAAAVVLAAFALSAAPRRTTGPAVRALAIVWTAGTYWGTMAVAESLAREGALAVWLAMWLPNLLFASTAVVCVAAQGMRVTEHTTG